MTIKDHCFIDGNKRIAAALFVLFLDMNNHLRNKNGQLLIDSNTLASITLMIALSKSEEKDLICSLIQRMLSEK